MLAMLKEQKTPQLEELRVLIVEDQHEARQMVRHMLMEFGITQIYEAANGREALNFMDEAFDLVNFIICDWNMPEMSGIELLRQMRSVYCDLPFLMITGRGDKASVLEAKIGGVSAYIAKPFSTDQLEAKMRVLQVRTSL